MNRQEFLYKSAAGDEYKLIVTDHGFSLYDKKTDEVLVDASGLVHGDGTLDYWAIECFISTINREFYFIHKAGNGDLKNHLIEFGISRRGE